MSTRECLIRDLANKRLAAVDAWATLPLDQSAALADEVWAEATWYVDQLLPHLTPQTPLPGSAVSAASTPPLSRRDPARRHTPAGQGNPTPGGPA